MQTRASDQSARLIVSTEPHSVEVSSQAWRHRAGLNGIVVDTSIHHAYVHAIRRARRFVYIENQCALTLLAVWPSRPCQTNTERCGLSAMSKGLVSPPALELKSFAWLYGIRRADGVP